MKTLVNANLQGQNVEKVLIPKVKAIISFLRETRCVQTKNSLFLNLVFIFLELIFFGQRKLESQFHDQNIRIQRRNLD